MKRWLPLALLFCLLLASLALGWHRHLSWAAVAEHHVALANFVARAPLLAALAFMAIYVVAVVLSVPGLVVLSLVGGLLFGILVGTVLVVLAATAGAVVLFLAVRMALAEPLARRFAPLAARLRPGLERDGFAYLLSLRLVAVVPFSLANLAAALVGMRLAPFTVATIIGIIPATLVFTAFGAGLGDIVAAGEAPGVAPLLAPGVLLPFLGMAGLALLPVAWRRRKGKNG